MCSGRNDIRQEEKQVVINYWSVVCHHGLFSLYRSSLVNLPAESRRDVACWFTATWCFTSHGGAVDSQGRAT